MNERHKGMQNGGHREHTGYAVMICQCHQLLRDDIGRVRCQFVLEIDRRPTGVALQHQGGATWLRHESRHTRGRHDRERDRLHGQFVNWRGEGPAWNHDGRGGVHLLQVGGGDERCRVGETD